MGRTIAAWLLIASAAASPAAAPREVVQDAVDRVVRVLEDARLNAPEEAALPRPGPAPARAAIRQIAGELFDFDEVSRRALSRHWAGRTGAERAEFVTLFTDLLERAYVGKIEAYSGETIVYTGEAVDGNYATVRSRIVSRRGRDTLLDYRLHRAGGRWKVYDVLIDGVSFVSTYRSEFNRIIQSSSYEELVDRLRRKSIGALTVRPR